MPSASISVVIPAYNAAPWIAETLACIAAQKGLDGPPEVIVVDDASTDDTVAVATATIARHLPHARIVRQPRNAGVSAARNAGLGLASGDWIQFLDADDLISPHKVARQLAAAARLPERTAAVWSPWQRYECRSGAWQPYGPIVDSRLGDDLEIDILRARFGYVGPMLFRRSAVRAVGGFRAGLRLGEDQELGLRLAMRGYRIDRVGAAGPCYFYRQTGANSSKSLIADVAAINDYLGVLREVETNVRARCGGALSREAAEVFVDGHDRHLRSLFDGDRAAFRQAHAHVYALQPNYLPRSRVRMRVLAQTVGYEMAEWLGHVARKGLGSVRRDSLRTD